MGFIMNERSRIPNPETAKRLLASLRQTRFEMQELNLQLAEINALLEQHDLQQRRQRWERVRERTVISNG